MPMNTPNQLMPNQAPQQMGGNQLVPQHPQRQFTPQEIQDQHQKLSDFQDDLKSLLHLPDEELNLSKVYGAASDLVSRNKLSNGKRGATALTIASELASPDFPKPGPNGEPPATKDIRKFLLNHFNKTTALQAAMTQKFGPPQAPTQGAQ